MAKTPAKTPSKTPSNAPGQATDKTPVGGIVFGTGDIEINAGRPRVTLKVRNTGDRPIQVGSHFHFFEVNRALEFDRPVAFGMRLDIIASTAVRFEPGDEKEVTLVPFGGKQLVYGFNGLVDNWAGGESGPSYTPGKTEAVRRAVELGFKSAPQDAPAPAAPAPQAAAKPAKPTAKK